MKLKLVGTTVPTLKDLQRHARLFGPGQVLETAADCLDDQDLRDLGDYLEGLKKNPSNQHWRGRAIRTKRYRVSVEAILDSRHRMDKGVEATQNEDSTCPSCGRVIALKTARRKYCSALCGRRARRAA